MQRPLGRGGQDAGCTYALHLNLLPALLLIGRHDGACLNPLRDGGDVGVGDLALGRHGHGVVGGAFMTDQTDEQRLRRISGENDGAIVTAL